MCVRRENMKALLVGMIVGALAVTAITNNKSSAKSVLRKGKRAIIKKVDDMLNV